MGPMSSARRCGFSSSWHNINRVSSSLMAQWLQHPSPAHPKPRVSEALANSVLQFKCSVALPSKVSPVFPARK